MVKIIVIINALTNIGASDPMGYLIRLPYDAMTNQWIHASPAYSYCRTMLCLQTDLRFL